MGLYTVKSYEFRRERERTWLELEDLVARVEARGVSALSDDELQRLPALYRAALSSLSVARAISLDRNVIDYLESLSARAYFCVYGSRRRGWEAVFEFLSRGFPRLVCSVRWGLFASWAVLLLGVGAGYFLTAADPERFYAFVDAGMAGGRGPTSSREELLAVLTSGAEQSSGGLTAFASFLFSHNAKIGMMCFALGFLAGVPVVLLLFTNGLTLGAMLAVHADKGLALEFATWVLPHGVTELLAVCLCGAAGFAVGHALVFPGSSRRIDNLARRGRDAGGVVLGSVLLFFVAALIEGYFRQLVHGVGPRALLAALTAVAWIAYFLRGRAGAGAPASSPEPTRGVAPRADVAPPSARVLPQTRAPSPRAGGDT
jgi:uncharacterized membrane protein SpoIIM required for sporulation